MVTDEPSPAPCSYCPTPIRNGCLVRWAFSEKGDLSHYKCLDSIDMNLQLFYVHLSTITSCTFMFSTIIYVHLKCSGKLLPWQSRIILWNYVQSECQQMCWNVQTWGEPCLFISGATSQVELFYAVLHLQAQKAELEAELNRLLGQPHQPVRPLQEAPGFLPNPHFRLSQWPTGLNLDPTWGNGSR